MPYAVEFLKNTEKRFFGRQGTSVTKLRDLESFFLSEHEAILAMQSHYMVQNGSWSPIRIVPVPLHYGFLMRTEYVLKRPDETFFGTDSTESKFDPIDVVNKFTCESSAKIIARYENATVAVVKSVIDVIE